MKLRILSLLGLFFLPVLSFSSQSLKELELHYDYRLIGEPLTTEKIWLLDPGQVNPHRQNWILNRQTELLGLEVKKESKDRFGVQLKGVRSVTHGYVRGPGPWFRPFTEFGCEKIPNDWFSTEQGAQVAVARASEVWSELLNIEKTKLRILLGRVSERTEELALSKAQWIFQSWHKQVEEAWRVKGMQRGRTEEWKSYLALSKVQAKEVQEGCLGLTKRPPRHVMMEPIKRESQSMTQLLARVPVRLWDGLFTVRLSIKILGRVLNGRFLIHPGLNQSIISPEWLENQGISPSWVIVRGSKLGRIHWGDTKTYKKNFLKTSNNHLAQRVQVGQVELSGLNLPLNEFFLLESNFFQPPENVGFCCDGALGRDFLRLYPIEFDHRFAPEIKIWAKDQFQGSLDMSWSEVSEIPWNGLVVDRLGVEVEIPFVSKGRFILDLPHGRLWSNQESLSPNPLKINKSGFTLEYRLEQGERVLKITQLSEKYRNKKWMTSGFRLGTVITQVDGRLSEEMDLWEVERRLAGEYGDTVILQWQTKDGLKISPFTLQ